MMNINDYVGKPGWIVWDENKVPRYSEDEPEKGAVYIHAPKKKLPKSVINSLYIIADVERMSRIANVQKRGPGRPKSAKKWDVQTPVLWDKEYRAKAAKISGRSISEGVRIAIDFWESMHERMIRRDVDSKGY
jgi:hypothetical protein